MADYIQNLSTSIKQGKTQQAKRLLAHIYGRHLSEKQIILDSIALARDETAFELLSFLTAKKNKDPEIHERLIQMVSDRAHLNFRFILILLENAQAKTLTLASPLLKHILSNETDTSILSAIIRNAGINKIKSLVTDLAEFIFYDDQNLKLDAVTALENIGTRRALAALEKAADTEKCDQHILDAIKLIRVKLEKESAFFEGEPASGSIPLPDFTQLAAPTIKKRIQAYHHLSQMDIDLAGIIDREEVLANRDLLINLLLLASRTIPFDCINPIFEILSTPEIDNDIKFAAYIALEAYPELESAASILKGLTQGPMHNRLAAIRVLDKNASDYVCAEIKNRIESGTTDGERLGVAILDARAKTIIERMMISDTFSYMASNYLSKSAPMPVLDAFIEILENRNLYSTARKYRDIRQTRQPLNQKQVTVISSCRTVHDLYSRLIYSCGFDCLAFSKAIDAFESIADKKPAAVICDLMLKEMSGLDLTREIRELYTKDDVPVILSSLQKNLDQTDLNDEMDNAGVNFFYSFPATVNQIKPWIVKS